MYSTQDAIQSITAGPPALQPHQIHVFLTCKSTFVLPNISSHPNVNPLQRQL